MDVLQAMCKSVSFPVALKARVALKTRVALKGKGGIKRQGRH